MNPVFKEVQRFRQWWIYLVAFLPVALFMIVGLLPVNDKYGNPIHFIDIIIPVIFSILFFVWFISLRLITIIDQEGIYVNFSGIPVCQKKLNWAEIEKIEVVNYEPLLQYGGWGLRYGFSKGWCYTVKGKIGLKLWLKNGKEFLIGTQQKEQLSGIITHYFSQ